MQETWLWFGFAGMSLGALAIAAIGRSGREEDKHHFITSFFVTLIAAASYFAMANGQGITQVGDREVYFARYIDWAFTTPLLLLGLLLIALPGLGSGGDSRTRNGLVAGLIGADVFMIVTGLIAALTQDETVKYVWYVISCGAFLAVLAIVLGPVRAAARNQGSDVAGLFDRLATVLAVLWFVYPVLWLLGTEGTEVLGQTGEVFVFAVIDVSAKVGFGILLVLGVKRLAGATRNEPGRSTVQSSAAPA